VSVIGNLVALRPVVLQTSEKEGTTPQFGNSKIRKFDSTCRLVGERRDCGLAVIGLVPAWLDSGVFDYSQSSS